MLKKIVIAGSLSFEDEIGKWVKRWTDAGYDVLDYPKSVSGNKFPENYPEIKKRFFENLEEADILFVVNEEKDGIRGYIGAQVFAEMVFVVANNLVRGKDTKVVLANMPSREVQSYEEIEQWLGRGWVELFEVNSLIGAQKWNT